MEPETPKRYVAGPGGGQLGRGLAALERLRGPGAMRMRQLTGRQQRQPVYKPAHIVHAVEIRLRAVRVVIDVHQFVGDEVADVLDVGRVMLLRLGLPNPRGRCDRSTRSWTPNWCARLVIDMATAKNLTRTKTSRLGQEFECHSVAEKHTIARTADQSKSRRKRFAFITLLG
jgi:hypothetical protein